MKKRILCLLLMLCMLLGMLPATAWAATDPANVRLYVARNDAIGMNGQSNIALKSGSGTVYLPGSADAAKCFLCWDDADVTVNGQPSGKVAVPAPGKSGSFTVTSGGKSASLTLKTLQGSEGVSGLFFTIDESLGTISAMNKDRLKEATCYGTATLDGTDMPMSIKGRGNSTWTNFDKKPYNFTTYTDNTYLTKEKHNLIADVSTNKWSILANAKDSTLIRNRLALELADKLDIGMPTRYVDVWINGEYRGNYLMTPKNDYQSPKAGYMIEIDNLNDPVDPQFSVRGFSGSRAPTFTVKDNKAGVTTDEIKAYVQKAVTAILDTKSSDYLNYIDVESWAKMILLNEFYKTTDVVSGSIFFTRAGLSDSDKLVAGPVWDFDVALGRAWAKSVTTVENEAQVSGGKWYIDNIQTDAWYRILAARKEIAERMYELYNEYKEYFDATPDFVREQDALVRASGEMNFDLWDVNRDQDHNPFTCTKEVTYGTEPYSVTYIAASTRDDYVTNLLTYVTARAKFLSDRLTVTAPTGTISGATTVKPGETMTLKASASGKSLSYQWQQGDGTSWENIPGATAETYAVAASGELNGKQFRCLARENGVLIDDVKYVAKVNAGAVTVLGPVKLTLEAGDHDHVYTSSITAPTCTAAGFTTYTCTVCGESYQGDEVPAKGHSFVNGKCAVCGMKPYTASFKCDSNCTVTVYKTQKLREGEANATTAYACASDTGIEDTSGDGQVNFVVVPAKGYVVDSVTAAPANYKNLKGPSETGTANAYRITKITGDFTVTVTTRATGGSEPEPEPFTATFMCDEHSSVTAYDTQALEGAHEKAVTAYARDSVSGAVDATGNGQVNFIVHVDEGYEIESVTAAPAASYKNLKDPDETFTPNCYRVTKVVGDFTVTVKTRKYECPHEYAPTVTAPTCTAEGFTTFTCAKCGDSYLGNKIPALGHVFVDGVCSRCGLTGYKLTFNCDAHCHVISYETHEYERPVENASYAFARNAETGEIDISGEGQVNFKIIVDEGYIVDMVSSKSANFKNLKRPADTEVENGYRVTKLVGDVVLDITTVKAECAHEYVAVETAPTCLEAGYITYTCSKCGDTYSEVMTGTAFEVETEVNVPSGLTSKRSGMTYGKVYNLTYHSSVAGRDKKVNVQVPADYDENKKYPVLYLLHGVMGSENDMVGQGTMIQNMVADGITEEMIIVCPNMFSGKSASPSGINQASMEGYDKFSDEIVTDLMPFIRDNFSVKEGKANTALAGFSLGGRETLSISLFHPDVFGYICAISSAPGVIAGKDMFMTHPGQFTEDQVKYPEGQAPFVMMTSGDRDSVVGTFPQEYDALYTKNGIEHYWWVIPGADHGGATNSGIYNFAKYVFKTAGASGPLGHDYKTVVTEPTCEAGGYTTYTCSRCGDTYQDSKTEALGHSWNEGAVTVEPTETTKGVMTFTCLRCGKTRTESIPEKAHTHKYTKIVTEPTCEDGGYTTYTCTCGDSYKTDEVAALGHDYKDEVTAPTCTAEGFTTHTCSRCGAMSLDSEVPAKGHHYENGKCVDCGEADPDWKVCPSKAFTDAPEKDNWAHEGIDFCVDKQYMNGVSNNLFNPAGNVTRAQLVTILYRVAEKPEIDKAKALKFVDVADGQWYSEAIAWASAEGVVNGVGQNKFNPMGAVTREQIATIFYRYAKANKVPGDLKQFPDYEDAHDYAVDALVWAVDKGIITGVKSGDVTNLKPLANATRAQIASILMRYLNGSYDCK